MKAMIRGIEKPLFVIDLDNTMIGARLIDAEHLEHYLIKNQKNMSLVLHNIKHICPDAKFVVLTNSNRQRAEDILVNALKLNLDNFVIVDCGDDSCFMTLHSEARPTEALDKFNRLQGIFEHKDIKGKFKHLVFIDDRLEHICAAGSFALKHGIDCHLYHFVGTKEDSDAIALLQRSMR